MLWAHEGYSLDLAREWIASQQDQTRQPTTYDFSIRDANDRFLGAVGLNQINTLHRFANLGYWVRSSTMGQGVAVEAVRLIAAFAFSQTDLVRLEIVCAVGNTRSQRVAEKAGAFREGLLRDRLMLQNGPVDAVMYSLLRP